MIQFSTDFLNISFYCVFFYTDLIKGSHRNSWLGLRGPSSSGVWNWTDKSDFSFSNWASGQPNGGSAKCVDVSINLILFDILFNLFN